MKTHETIKRELQGDLLDENHSTRRFFRCWLDGSYKGEHHYRQNVEFLKANKGQPRKLRSFVIGQFVEYTAHDAECSTGYAGRIIKETIEPWTLEKLNEKLIDDALDLIREDA